MALRAFQVYPIRVTATVETDFVPGCRWLEVLGFKKHPDILESYGPDGRDHFAYVREP
jgi:hypothetical protein